MASFVASVAWKSLAALLAKVGVTIAEKSTSGTVARSLDESGPFWDNRQELEAKIQAIFGDSLSKELIELKRFLDATINDATTSLKALGVEQALFAELNPIVHKVRTIHEAFCYYIESPYVDFRKKEFKLACEKHEPHAVIDFFHQQIRQGSFNDTLLDRILLTCQTPRNIEKFDIWRKRIESVLLMACFLRAFDLRLKLEDRRQKSGDLRLTLEERGQKRGIFGASITEGNQTVGRLVKHFNNDFPAIAEQHPKSKTGQLKQDMLRHTIALELHNLGEKQTHIMTAFSKASVRLRCHFLTEPCGDTKHINCGAMDNKSCCILGAHTDGLLAENVPDESLGERLAKSLREKWPSVSWCAAVVTGTCEVLSMDARVWFHSQGTEREATPVLSSLSSTWKKRLAPVTLPQLSDSGLGCLHRYRKKANGDIRHAVVFWADPDEIEAVSLERQTLADDFIQASLALKSLDRFARYHLNLTQSQLMWIRQDTVT